MARDSFDESKSTKKKVTKKKTEVTKPQSSSVTKSKTTTTKADKVASKSTFLGGGAPVQKVEQAASKPTTVKKPANTKKQTVTKQDQINQKMYGTTKPNVTTKTQRTKRDTKPVTSKSQRKENAEANMNLKQRNIRDTAPVQSRRTATTTAAQRQKMGMPTQQDLQDARASRRELANSVRSSVREATSETNKGFMQRQKSGTLTASDKQRIEKTNQRRAEVARNTRDVAKKAVIDTGSGYAQSIYDLTELTAGNKNGTQAKAMKMGLDPVRDRRRIAELEREQKYTAAESKRRRDELFQKQEQRQAEWDERTKNAKGLEKAWYGAVESGTGMVADTLVGAASGTGQFGALASMGLRTYGSSANQARKEGATDKEARLYGLAQSAKEVGTELMFQGAGLAKAAYGKTGLSLADKSANILTRGLTGLKADAVGAGVRALGGTAEENIEELAGWMADPLIKELTYGKAVRNRMKENLRANIPQIGSDADAAHVASYFSTPKFTDDLTNEYVKSGMSRDKASSLAAEMRDYYVAYYSGDKGRLDALEEDLAAKLSGQDKLSFRSWSMDELKDTFASTTLLTLATGLPGAVTTSVKGNQIFDSDEVKAVFGNDAVRKVADAVKNTSNREMSLKAETMEDRLNSGKDLTGTQKYDLYQGYIEKVNETAKKARASNGVVENARQEQNLVPTMGVDRAGNTVYAKETQREYDEKYAETAVTAESLRRFMESDNSISDDEIRRTDAAIKAVSDLHVGGLTIGDAHEFAYGNNLARETLKIEEGIDLDKYIVRKADGTVDLAATNEATENALFRINAENAIKAAQAETEVYIDDTRGNIDKDLLTRFGNNGQAVWKEVNKDLDPRDLKNYLTNANAASYFYSAGRNTDMSVDTAVNRFADTFKTVDKSVMKRAFAAGARDRIIANTPGYGQTVESGSNIQLKKTEPVITGQLIMDDDVVLADSDQSAYLALAMSTNTNIHIVSNLNAMGKDGKPIINQATGLPVQLNGMSHGNDIYLSMNEASEKNLGYVFMHEMTHQIKQYAPNEYLALENLVRDKWFNKDATGMQAAIKQRMDLYSVKGGQQLTEEEAVEEIIADAMAEAMDDPNFAAEVCEQDINLGEKILESIRGALRSIRQIFANSDYKNDRFHNSLLSYLGILDEAEKMWLNALATAKQNKADGLIADWQDKANKQNAPRLSVGEGKYSITTDKEDFIKGANLSKDLRDWAKEMGLDKLSKQPIKGPVIVSVRDLRTAWYEKNGRTDETNVINTALDKIGDSLTQLVGKYQYIDLGDALNAAVTYRTDAEGNPTSVILSCQVKNAEYEVNFDFTTICAKRLAMQKILERFIKTEGERQGTTLYDELKLDEEGLYKLRLILETAGFDVSCRGCFVEQNRYSQQNQARTIANDWNAALDDWARENGTEVTENFGLTTLDIDNLDYEEIEAGFERYHELMKGKKTDVATKNRMLIEASPFFRKRMNASDYASMTGQRALMAIGESKKGGTNLYGLLKRGQSDSKQSVPFTAYNGEISLLPDNMKGKSLYDYLLSIGGARAQSASDFQIEFVYDYMQMVADLSARGLPMHMYTKVIELAELFGMTGIKINLSAMCDVAEDVGGEYAGLKLVDGKYEYNISDQSIDYPKAVELQKRDGYSKNIGIIMVTLSSQHMLKSLDDPDVRYIIGYHSSAMPVVVANMSNMGGATDYTKINKTNKLNEKGQALFDEAMAEAKGNIELEKYKDALRIFDEKIQEETAKKKKKPRRGNEYGAYMSAYGNNTADFNTYDSLLETKDARKTADKYLEHCMENGLIPIYFPFAFHENYYKCEVYDFNMYDNNTGEYAPMEGVQNIYPGLNMAAGETDTTAFTERVSQMMDAQNRTNKALDSQYDAVFDEAKNTLKYSITGDDYMDFDASGIDHSDLTHRADAIKQAPTEEDIAEGNNAVHKGKAFWSGSASALDGFIEETHTYQEAENWDFHHSLYFSPEQVEKIDNEENVFFWVWPDGSVETQWRNDEAPANIVRAIKAQITTKADGIRMSISEDLDEPYMDAVNSGNMDEAQRLVDEAARMAMPNTKLKGRWYHGTENEFTEFNFSQGGKNGTADGFGIYLTNDPEVASSYGNRMIEGYVNVERPASALTTATLTKPELHRLIRRTVDIEAETLQYDGYDSLEDAKKDTWISNYVDTYSAKNLEDAIADVTDSILQLNGNDMDIVQEIMTGMGIRDYDSAMDFYDMLTEETGIDGFETKWGDESEMADPNTPTIALAFRSSQIKSADTITYAEDGSVIPLSERFDPTNNDIRYSLPTQDSEGNILTDGQMEYFRNSQARDAEGKMQVVYHTTNMGGFTVFDPSYSDDKRSLFFASNFDVSQTYGFRAKQPIKLLGKSVDYKSYRDFEKDYWERHRNSDYEYSALSASTSPFDYINAIVLHKEDNSFASELGYDEVGFNKWLKSAEKGEKYADRFIVEYHINGKPHRTAYSLDELLNYLKEDMEEKQATQRGYYSCYLNLENPLIVDAQNQSWNNIPYGEYSEDAVLAIKNLTVQDMGDGIYVNIWGDRKVDGKWQEFRESDTIEFEYLTVDGEYEIPERAWDEVYDFLVKQGLSSDYAYEHSDAFFDFNGLDTFDKDGRKVESDVRRYRTRELAALADAKGYDSVIIRNCYDIGAASHLKGEGLSDIYIAFSSNQVKDINNENPTENPDIRYSIATRDEVSGYLMQNAESITDIPLEDARLEENRIRYSLDATNFENSIIASWDRRKRNLAEEVQETPLKNELIRLMKQVRKGSGTDRKYSTETIEETIRSIKKMYYFAKGDKAKEYAREAWDAAERIVDDIDYNDELYKQYQGITDYFASYRINLSEDLFDAFGNYKNDEVKEDFEKFIKDNSGKIRFSWERFSDRADDIELHYAYGELSEKYPGLFPSDIDNPIDMLLQMDYVLNLTDPYRDAYTSEEHSKLVEDIANSLCNIVDEGNEYKATIDDLNVKAMKQRHREAILKVKEIEKQKRDNQIRRAELWKARYNERIKQDKADKEAGKQKQNEKKFVGDIEKNIKWLSDRLRPETRSKDNAIPEQFRSALAGLLAEFDLQSKGSKKIEKKKGYPSKTTLKLKQLRDQYAAIAKENDDDGNNVFRYNGDLLVKMDELIKTMEGLDKFFDKRYGREVTIADLSLSEMFVIDTMLKSLVHQFREYKNVTIESKRAEIAGVSSEVIGDMDTQVNRHGAAREGGALGKVNGLLNMAEVTPIYFFKRLGAMYKMYRELRRGFDKYIENDREVIKRLSEIMSGYYNKKNPGTTIESWRTMEDAQTFNFEYGSVTLSVAQMMEVYLYANRPQAFGHMIGDGIIVTPISPGGKIATAKEKLLGHEPMVDPVRLTYENVQEIISKLSEEQANMANKLQELVAGYMSDLGNETTMKLYGYKMFDDPNYFGIHVSQTATNSSVDAPAITETIKNFGWTKPLTPGAKNTIVIGDIFTDVARYCNEMNQFNAYAVPVSDFMRVYNYTLRDEDGTLKGSAKSAIIKAFGNQAHTYIMNFLRDLNGASMRRNGGLEGMIDSALGKAKKAAVFMNMRVALQQPTAIIRALAQINARYFVGVRPSRKATQEMIEHCPIAQWKAWGFYDTHFGRDVEDLIMNNWSKADVIGSALYGALDNMTWGMIWQAVKKEVEAKQPALDKGSPAYWEACNRRASEVFDSTQVVDSPFHRSDAMRSKDTLVKQFTSFQAEPTLSFNVVRDFVVQAYDAVADGDKSKAAKLIAKGVEIWTLQAAVVAVAQSLWDAVRHKDPDGDDDEDEGFLELWWQNFMADFVDDLKFYNNIYFLKEFTPYAEKLVDYMKTGKWDTYDSNKLLMFQGAEKMTQGLQQLIKKIQKGDEYKHKNGEPYTWYEVMTNFLGGVGYLTGMPIGTVMRDAQSILKWFHINVFAADGTEEKTKAGLMDAIANKMGYQKAGSGNSEEGSTYSQTADDLPDNLTDEQKEEIIKAGEKRAEKNASKGTSNGEKVDYDELTYKAMKAAAGLEGEEYDKKVYSVIANGLKDYAQNANYYELSKMRDAIEAAGGDVNYFDQQVVKNSKTAFKKSIKADMTPDEVNQQALLYHYLVTHGVSQEEISSEIVYKSELAKDMKVAFRIGDEETINEALEPLAQAGILQEDLDRLWTNRNRIDLTKYKENGGRYADKLKSMGTFIWPTDGVITSHFGYRNAPTAGASSNHPAIDIGAPQGTAVVAADGGVVISAGANGGYGNSVGIKHDNGMITWYNHLYDWNVKVGDTVAQGQQIAQVGSTGISTGPHLDFKIMDTDGNPVDPEKYLATR